MAVESPLVLLTLPPSYECDPGVGTMEHFIEFMHAAGERGLRVMLDRAFIPPTSPRGSSSPATTRACASSGRMAV